MKVIDVPCVRELVTLAVLEIVRTSSGCLGGQVRAKPFWLKFAYHLGILFFDEDHVSWPNLMGVYFLISPSGGLSLIYAKVVDCLASKFFCEVFY